MLPVGRRGGGHASGNPSRVACLGVGAVVPNLRSLSAADAEVAEKETDVAGLLARHVDFDEHDARENVSNGKDKVVELGNPDVSRIAYLVSSQ